MKLDVSALRYLSGDEFRTLTAVEMGMKNHEIVPANLVDSIAKLKRGGVRKALDILLKHKLVHHENKIYDGFRLTPLGYDYLAIKALINRGAIHSIGRQVGVGKEADVFEVLGPSNEVLILKLHRLGRTSFRAVKAKRDYLKRGKHFNWLYLSRLAAAKEFAFMRALHDHAFRTPVAVDCNRHVVLMTAAPGIPLTQSQELAEPYDALREALAVVARLARHGLVHCDLNEFNLIVNDDEQLAKSRSPRLTVIDFPQMVSTSHPNARMLFERDVQSLLRFFYRRFRVQVPEEEEEDVIPQYDEQVGEMAEAREQEEQEGEDGAMLSRLDAELRASGFDNWAGEDLTADRLNASDDEEEEEEEEEEDDDDDDDDDENEGRVRRETASAHAEDSGNNECEEEEEEEEEDDDDDDVDEGSSTMQRRRTGKKKIKDAAAVDERVREEMRARAAREAARAKMKAAMARGRANKKGGKSGRDGF